MINFVKKQFQTSVELILRIAVIATPAIWLIFLVIGIYSIVLINSISEIIMPTSFWSIVIVSITGSFIFLAISTILGIFGQNKKGMIMLAGFFYCFTAISSFFLENRPFIIICGITAVLCFIRFAKMQKQVSIMTEEGMPRKEDIPLY